MTPIRSISGIGRLVLGAVLAVGLSTGMATAQFDVSGGMSAFDGGSFDGGGLDPEGYDFSYDNGVQPHSLPIVTDNGLRVIDGLVTPSEPSIFDYEDVPGDLKTRISSDDFQALMRRLLENRPVEVLGLGPLLVTPSGTAGGGYVFRALSAPGFNPGNWQPDAPAEPQLVVDKSVIGIVNSGGLGVGFRIMLEGQPRVLTMAAGEVRTFECMASCTGAKVTFNRSGSGTETASDIALGKLYRFRQGADGWSLSE